MLSSYPLHHTLLAMLATRKMMKLEAARACCLAFLQCPSYQHLMRLLYLQTLLLRGASSPPATLALEQRQCPRPNTYGANEIEIGPVKSILVYCEVAEQAALPAPVGFTCKLLPHLAPSNGCKPLPHTDIACMAGWVSPAICIALAYPCCPPHVVCHTAAGLHT